MKPRYKNVQVREILGPQRSLRWMVTFEYQGEEKVADEFSSPYEAIRCADDLRAQTISDDDVQAAYEDAMDAYLNADPAIDRGEAVFNAYISSDSPLEFFEAITKWLK